MSITLVSEIISGNQASVRWDINGDALSSNSRVILCLTDINTANNAYPIVKYQLRSFEYNHGVYVFENLLSGKYVAQIIIITGSVIQTSNKLELEVFQMTVPEFEENGIIPGDKSFTISLVNPNFNMINGKVTFVLFGQSILRGVTQEISTDIINMVLPYNANNTYVIDDSRLENDDEYEMSCFYTNSQGYSSELSDTLIIRTTNLPTKITEVAAIYNAVARTLTFTHNMPINVEQYVTLDCRATITDTVTQQVKFFNTKLNELTPEDSIVFNMDNQEEFLFIDHVFTVSLAIENVYGYGEESNLIYCVHPVNFSSKPVLNENLDFAILIEDNSLQINDAIPSYVENTNYNVRYVSEVFECSPVNGARTGERILIESSNARPSNINYTLSVSLGKLYKYTLNVFYDVTFEDETSVTINPNTMDECYYYFIPHVAADALTLSVVPDNEIATISWDDLNVEQLQGYELHHYEYYKLTDVIPFDINDPALNWTSVEKNTSKMFDELDNGISNTYYFRAVTYSNNERYGYDDRLKGAISSISVTPFGTPKDLIKDTQTPDDGICTVVFHLSEDAPFNGGDFNKFEVSVDAADFVELEPSYDNVTKKYTNVFNLSNFELHTILIRIVTQNKLDDSFTKNSNNLVVETIPFPKPLLPTNFRAVPYTTTVDLSWTAPELSEIISNQVKYEVSYKLNADEGYIVLPDPSPLTTKTVPGLTSNALYDFRVRTQVYNSELDMTIYSISYSSVSSRPFVYLNAPVMELVTGVNSSQINVKLSPAIAPNNNYYNGKFNYYATIYEKSDTNMLRPKIASALNIETQAVQILPLNFFNDGDNDDPNVDPALFDWSLYRVEAYYEMYNTETSTFYASNDVMSEAYPYDPLKVPVLSAVAGNLSTTLSWDVSSLNGYNITGYELSSDLSNAENWSLIASENITQNSEFIFSTIISPLNNGQTYSYYVRVKIDTDKYTGPSKLVNTIPYTEPGAPANLTLTVSSMQIVADWSAGVLGGLPLDSYQVKIGNGQWIPKGNSTTHTFDGLINGETYSVDVQMITKAVYENNTLHYSNSSTASAKVYDLAKAPANFVTRSYENPENTVSLSWDEVTGEDLGGLPFDHYEVTHDNVTWVNVGSNLSYDYAPPSDYTPNSIYRGSMVKEVRNAEDMYKFYSPYTFAVRVITIKPNNALVSGNQSTSKNMFVRKPAKLEKDVREFFWNSAQVARCLSGNLGGTHTNLGAIDNLLYMKLPNVIVAPRLSTFSYDQGASNPIYFNELFFYATSDLAYEVSKDAGANWVQATNSQSYVINGNGGLNSPVYVWGTNGTYTNPPVYTMDTMYGQGNSVMDFVNVPDGSIALGQEYRFSVRRVGYNLYNPDPDRPIYSDPSDIILNTSFHVSPQERVFNPIDTVYLANALLNVTATPSNGKISLSWDAANASVLGGLTFNYYEVQLDSGSWTRVDTTSYEFSGSLDNGTEYTVSVRTNCSHTERDITGLVTTRIFAGTPVSIHNIPFVPASAPTTLAVSYPDSRQVKIVWNPVLQLGGLPLKMYKVSKDNGASWISVAKEIREYTFDNLTNGAEYNIRVMAVTDHKYNGEIEGAYDTILAVPRATPVAPTFISSVQGDTELTLTWGYDVSTPGVISFSAFNGGASIADITTDAIPYVNNNNGTYTYTFTRLTNGLKYNLQIIAVLSIPSTSELVYGMPLTVGPLVPYKKAAAPIVSNITAGDKEIKVEWNEVTDLGGLNFLKYQVSNNNGDSWTDVGSALEYTFTILNNGTTYGIKVRAVTNYTNPNIGPNEGNASVSASAIPFVKPDQVHSVNTSAVNNIFTFSFSPPVDVNNNAFTQYYEYTINNGANWYAIDLSVPWPNLNIGDDEFALSLRVYILNSNDNVTPVYSEVVTVNGIQNINVTTPENLKAVPGNGSITLTWDLVPNVSYMVVKYQSPLPLKTSTTNNTYTFNGLQNGTEYKFGVIMYVNNVAGPIANITAIPMSAPIINSVTKSDNVLSMNVNYGGSSTMNVKVLAQTSESIDGEEYIVIDSMVELSSDVNSTTNPITFNVSSRNYFYITLSNSVGSISGLYRRD